MIAALPTRTFRHPLSGTPTREEKKMTAAITNIRGARDAWGELLDALALGFHTFAAGGILTNADRVLLVVQALKFWPDNSVRTMVDRVEVVEQTAAAADAGALAILADRDHGIQTVSSLLRPIICVSAVRPFEGEEIPRLCAAIRAAGEEPVRFGLDG